MVKQIHIGDVKIPLESYAISGTAVLGIKESGKTVLAKGIVEQLLEHGVMPIVFDAIGVWRHLKVPGEGSRGKGFKVVVAGGKEPDLPLTPGSAAEIVRAAIRENIPLVIDLYDKRLSKADWRKIVQTCFRTLLYENEGVRHIILEETAEYAPQKILDGETYAEVEKLVRMGGNASLGITLINQRAQEVNKAILDLCENMVLMRQRGAHAIDSLEKWMDRMAPEQSRGIAKKLPNMTAGECFVFHGASDVAVHTRSTMCRSFHPDRRKPVPVGAIAERKVITSDFVTRLSADLSKVIEEIEANDPKKLKARIAELERMSISRASNEAAKINTGDGELQRRIAVLEQDNRTLEDQRDTVAGRFEDLRKWCYDEFDIHAAAVEEQRARLSSMPKLPSFKELPKPSAPPPKPATPRLPERQAAAAVSRPSAGSFDLSLAERRVLTVLAQHGPCDAGRLALLAGYTYSGGFRNALSSLRTSGLIEGANTGTMSITDAGMNEGPFDPLPSGAELREHWLRFSGFGAGERKVLQALLDHPRGLDAPGLCAITGYEYSGGFRNYLSTLRTAGVLVGRNTETMRASAELLS